jgi:hypothetical protein
MMPRFFLLLLPSILSGVFVIIVALIILGASAWSYINDNLLFYDQLFGIYGFKTLLLQTDGLYALRHAVLDNSMTYYILLVMAGAAIGIIIYTLLEAARFAINTTVEEIHEIGDSGPTRKIAAQEALERLLLRITGVVSWGIYFVLFGSIILPFCIILVQTAVDNFESMPTSSVLPGIGAFILLSVGLHTHIVFARLCMLRPRLFGDSDIEESKYRRLKP